MNKSHKKYIRIQKEDSNKLNVNNIGVTKERGTLNILSLLH